MPASMAQLLTCSGDLGLINDLIRIQEKMVARSGTSDVFFSDQTIEKINDLLFKFSMFSGSNNVIKASSLCCGKRLILMNLMLFSFCFSSLVLWLVS